MNDFLLRRASLLRDAAHTSHLREIAGMRQWVARPSVIERRGISRLVSPIYRHALDVVRHLENVERGDEKALAAQLKENLLLGLDDWQRFELAAALGTLSALSTVLNKPVEWRQAFLDAGLIASVGQYEVYWQYGQPKRPYPYRDERERAIADVMSTFGLSEGTPRADVAILKSGIPVGFVECKWGTSPQSIRNSISAAVTQLVSYSIDAGHSSGMSHKSLLMKSAVFVPELDSAQYKLPETGTALLQFSDAINTGMTSWVKRVVSS